MGNTGFLLIVFLLISLNPSMYFHEPINYSSTTNTTVIIRVPQDYSSLQEAIDNAGPNTIIVVSNGIYSCGITLHGKRDLVITGSNKTVFIAVKNITCFHIAWSQNITLSNIIVVVDINSSYKTSIDLFNIYYSENIVLGNSILNGTYSDKNPTDLINLNLFNIVSVNNLSIHNISTKIVFPNINIYIEELRHALISNTSLEYSICSIRNSSNIYFINTFFHNITEKAVLNILSSHNFKFINSKIYGSLNIEPVKEFLITSSFNNTWLNNKPIVFYENKDFQNTSLTNYIKSRHISMLILRNISNIVIENMNVENQKSSIFIYSSKNIYIANISVSGSLFFDKISNVELINIIYSSVHINDSHKIIMENMIQEKPYGIFYVNYSTYLVINNLHLGPVENTMLAQDPYLSQITWDTTCLYINSSSHVLVNNSLISLLVLDSSTNIEVYNTGFNTSILFYDLEILVYLNKLLNIGKAPDTELIRNKYRETLDTIYRMFSTLKLENVSINGYPIVFLKNHEGNEVKLYIDLVSQLILFNTSNIKVYNVSGLNTRIPLIIINSSDLDISMLDLSYKQIFFVESRNISIYLCNMVNTVIHNVESSILFYSRDIYVYVYNDVKHACRLGNYLGLNIVDQDGNGIGDQPIIYDSFLILYPLKDSFENYYVIGKLEKLIAFTSIPVNNTLVSKRLVVNVFLKEELNIRVIIYNTTFKDVVNNYYQLQGNQTLDIDLSKYYDGFYTIEFIIYLDNILYSYNVEINILIDNTPPKILFISPPNNSAYYTGKIVIEWIIIESHLSKVIFYIDGKPVNISTSNKYVLDLRELSIGRHNITIVAIDEVGNIGYATLYIVRKGIGPLTLEHGLLLIFSIITLGLIILFSLYRRKTSSGKEKNTG